MRKLVLALALTLATVAPAFGQGATLGLPIFQAVTNSGLPCSGCKLYAFVSGTLQPATVYTNRARTAQHPHPVVLDSGGRVAVFVDPAVIYDFRLDGSSGVQVWALDGYGDVADQAVTDLSSTTNLTFTIDSDNNETNALFRFRNGVGQTVFSVDESGAVVSTIAVGVDDLSITTGKLAALAVTRPKLAADVVDGTKLADNSVSGEHIAAGVVTTTHIMTGGVGQTDLAVNAVTADAIAANAVTPAKISGILSPSNIGTSVGSPSGRRLLRDDGVFDPLLNANQRIDVTRLGSTVGTADDRMILRRSGVWGFPFEFRPSSRHEP